MPTLSRQFAYDSYAMAFTFYQEIYIGGKHFLHNLQQAGSSGLHVIKSFLNSMVYAF